MACSERNRPQTHCYPKLPGLFLRSGKGFCRHFNVAIWFFVLYHEWQRTAARSP